MNEIKRILDYQKSKNMLPEDRNVILNLAMVLCIFGKKKEGNIDCLGDRVRL